MCWKLRRLLTFALLLPHSRIARPSHQTRTAHQVLEQEKTGGLKGRTLSNRAEKMCQAGTCHFLVSVKETSCVHLSSCYCYSETRHNVATGHIFACCLLTQRVNEFMTWHGSKCILLRGHCRDNFKVRNLNIDLAKGVCLKGNVDGRHWCRRGCEYLTNGCCSFSHSTVFGVYEGKMYRMSVRCKEQNFLLTSWVRGQNGQTSQRMQRQ